MPDQSVKLLQRALAAKPDDASLLRLLAGAHLKARRLVDALHLYNRLFELNEAEAADWLEAGRALVEVREYAQALSVLNQAPQVASTPEVCYELGRAAFALGDLEGAKTHFEAAAEDGDSLHAWLSLAKIIPGVPSATHATVREVRKAFADRLRREVPAPPPRSSRQPHPGHERLRVGYVSAFFERANYMKPVWGLVNHHDRKRFDVHLYSDSPTASGFEGYQPHSNDTVHDIAGLDHVALARLVQECEIDILIDLNSYSDTSRLPLFLEPVAPVTAAWFNLYATSGLPGLDLVIGDREVVRPEEESEYTERVVCLPGSYLTFEVGHRAPPIGPPPCEANGFVTFGSLITQYKLTHVVLDAWAEILRRAESSRLVLGNRAIQSPCNREYLLRQFTDRGIAGERLTFLGPAEHYEFLNYYNQIDVALDAFPYNGGTTTMEAIWQGVPVLTFDGDRWASRTSQTLLRRTHLADFVAANRQSYIDTAVAIAGDPQAPARLAALRLDMRDRLLGSPACDADGLAREMERIYLRAANVNG